MKLTLRDIRIAFAMGPDDLKVELVEVKGQPAPIELTEGLKKIP